LVANIEIFLSAQGLGQPALFSLVSYVSDKAKVMAVKAGTSIQTAYLPCQPALSACLVSLPCQPALSACLVSLPCQPALSACLVSLPCQPALFFACYQHSCFVEVDFLETNVPWAMYFS
jgi:hypothetical protein